MFQKKVISELHVRDIADKKTAYNEGPLYFNSQYFFENMRQPPWIMGVACIILMGIRIAVHYVFSAPKDQRL